jgi:hypothetical protein
MMPRPQDERFESVVLAAVVRRTSVFSRPRCCLSGRRRGLRSGSWSGPTPGWPVSVGLRAGPATLQHTGERDGVELDVVSHDLLKFATLMTGRNGYVLEQLLSPLVSSPRRSTPNSRPWFRGWSPATMRITTGPDS